MEPRSAYHGALERIRQEILQMGVLVEEAIRKVVNALLKHDVQAAEAVIQGDEAINRKETQIEDEVIVLIAREQPVAGDLRRLVTGLKIVAQLERMGDHAVHVAKAVRRMSWDGISGATAEILDAVLPRMGEACARMLNGVLSAFVDSDPEKASDVARMDQKVDELRDQVEVRLLEEMKREGASVERALNLLFTARYLERIADHVTNISEWIVYGETASHVELNP